MPPLCVSTIKQYKHYMPKDVITQSRPVKHGVNVKINCTSAGWLESEPSSRSQDPNVRPQGIDYCQCFVMDVSSTRSETESVKGLSCVVHKIVATSYCGEHCA